MFVVDSDKCSVKFVVYDVCFPLTLLAVFDISKF